MRVKKQTKCNFHVMPLVNLFTSKITFQYLSAKLKGIK